MSKRKPSYGRIEMIDLRKMKQPWELSDAEMQIEMAMRLLLNLAETGHPFHHLTANGAVVETDPTLEYYLSRQPEASQPRIREHWLKLVKPNARPARPVNRAYYGHDPFAEHAKEERKEYE